MIYIKNDQQIAKIKQACAIWKKIRQALIENTKPGVSTKKLDKLAANICKQNNAQPSFYKYEGFPGYICISVNEQIIHGISSAYKLKKSDIVTFDVGVTYQGYYCDAAFSIVLDDNNKQAIDLNNATYDCLLKAIEEIKPGAYLGNICNTIQETAKQHGYCVIENFGGHGCGLKIHEDPIILNHGQRNTGCRLKPGMILCIEPMLFIDNNKYIIDKDNHWTVCSFNKKLTCHWEHMVLVTNDGYEILTK